MFGDHCGVHGRERAAGRSIACLGTVVTGLPATLAEKAKRGQASVPSGRFFFGVYGSAVRLLDHA